MLSNELFHSVHRGLSLVRDGIQPELGVHWSVDPDVAGRFAFHHRDPSWQAKYARVLHADVPMSSVETDTAKLRARGYGSFPGANNLGEQEVMVKEGAPIKVTGMTKMRASDGRIKERKRTYNPPREMKA